MSGWGRGGGECRWRWKLRIDVYGYWAGNVKKAVGELLKLVKVLKVNVDAGGGGLR